MGGFRQYVLSINSDNSNDYFFNVVIKPINNLNLSKTLKEVNIIIKYYNKQKKINADEIYKKNFAYNTDKYSNTKLIINNFIEIDISSNDLNYFYYLRIIKKNNILDNEELNTIASVSSNLIYINKFNTTESNQNFSFNLNNLENNVEYIASFFIKVENRSEGEEIFYSMTYEFNTKLEEKPNDSNDSNNNNNDSNDNRDSDSNSNWLILVIFIIILIIASLIFFVIYRKIRLKTKYLEDKIDAISFSNEINEGLINDLDLDKKKGNEDYENTFI